jgi:CRP-like cAMP-binding protein/small-conductance mechanosensitive channel
MLTGPHLHWQTEILWVAGQLLGVVVIAALVNQFARAQRPRLRRVVMLFTLYVLMLAAALLFQGFNKDWSGRFQIGADLFRVISLVNMAGMVIFLILFPAVSIRLPMIAGDLLAGISYVVATVAVLTRHGLDPSSAIATGAVVSAVLAISLQATLGNILGGVALQLDGSISEGDYIQLDNGKHGRVRMVRWRHTIVDTPDSTTIIVPNAHLLANNITILGARDGRRAYRTWVNFSVDSTYAPARVIRAVNEALAKSPIENVAVDPAPSCVCIDITRADGFAIYAVRYWLVEVGMRDDTDSVVRARIATVLRRAAIPLANKERPVSPAIEGHLAALRAVNLFAKCTEQELRTLAETMTYAPYVAGETILRQGARAAALFIMTSGTVEVRTRFDPDGSGPMREHSGLVATLTAPDFFGEMGLMTGEPRGADVIAKTDVECLRLYKEAFEKIVKERPEIASELSEKLAARRVALGAVREDLDEESRHSLSSRERDRIRDGIKKFFGL